MILSGSESQVLAHALSSELDEPVLPLSYRRFADGELIVEVPRDQALPSDVILNEDSFSIDSRAVIVASTVSPQAHIELLQLQDLALEGGADTIVTVIPYLGYARQDVAHDPGQPVSARGLANALGASTDRVVTVNPHEESVLDYFPSPAESVSAVKSLAAGLHIESERPVIIAPDEGARALAQELREGIGRGTVDHFEKERQGDESVEMRTADTDVAGQEVILIDDTIATGGTIATAGELLANNGAETVRVACVHPLLVGAARTRIRQAGVNQIVGTDTIERTVSTVSAASVIAEVL